MVYYDEKAKGTYSWHHKAALLISVTCFLLHVIDKIIYQ